MKRVFGGVSVVEAVPLENRSRRTVTMHCNFTQTISRNVATGGSLSASAKGTVFKVVEAEASATVHRTVTQTAGAATSAGGSVRLRPGQRVICQRTYGFVRTKVTERTYRPGSQSTRRFTAKVPVYLGARIVD